MLYLDAPHGGAPPEVDDRGPEAAHAPQGEQERRLVADLQ